MLLAIAPAIFSARALYTISSTNVIVVGVIVGSNVRAAVRSVDWDTTAAGTATEEYMTKAEWKSSPMRLDIWFDVVNLLFDSVDTSAVARGEATEDRAIAPT